MYRSAIVLGLHVVTNVLGRRQSWELEICARHCLLFSLGYFDGLSSPAALLATEDLHRKSAYKQGVMWLASNRSLFNIAFFRRLGSVFAFV